MITVDRNKEQNTFFYVLDFNGLSSFDYFLWISFVLYKSLASGFEGLVCITKKTSVDDALNVFIQI